MRRLLSILLFGAMLFPLIAPVLSSGGMAGSTLPACCRRGGKHQCGMLAADRAMTMAPQSTSAFKSVTFTPPFEKCPYSQRSLAPVHLQIFAPDARAAEAINLLQQPSAAAQAECLWRISFDRSRQKRGPPTFLS
jgi:hypothetical protein